MRKLAKSYLLILLIFVLIINCNFTVMASDSFYCWNCGKLNYRSSTTTCSYCGWNKCAYCGACDEDGCPGFSSTDYYSYEDDYVPDGNGAYIPIDEAEDYMDEYGSSSVSNIEVIFGYVVGGGFALMMVVAIIIDIKNKIEEKKNK